MNEPYQTPSSLVDAEQQLDEALGKLTSSLEGVEALSDVASAFADASHANKAAVAAFRDASNSFAESSAATLASLDSIGQDVAKNQRKFSDALSEIRREQVSQNKKIALLRVLTLVTIVVLAALLVGSFAS
jgi:hypothetical protein